MFNNADRATAETIALLISAITAVLGNTVCERGQYGKHCNLTCPLNCAPFPPSNLQPCDRDTGKCSVGCLSGWHGDLCEQDCNMNCLNKTCNRQTGHCTLDCNGTNIGDFCNVTQALTSVVGNNTEESSSLAAILVPVILIAAIGVLISVIAFFRKRRQMNGYQVTERDFNEMEALLNPGVMSEDLFDIKMREAGQAFVNTDIYRRVKQTLDKHRHVTMSGSAGGGKTAIALQLGKDYKEREFQIVYVTDICKFKLNQQAKNTCFIFHDILKTIDLRKDENHLQSILHQLKLDTSIKEENIYVIITANTYNETDEISQLGEEGAYFFSGLSFLDFNKLSCQYTTEEKKQIFDNHCQGFENTLNVENICEFEQSVIGFPQTCKLFSGSERFQRHSEMFFKRPFQYIQEDMTTYLEGMDDQSAALILMFLCEGTLCLQQVELASENKDLESKFTIMQDVVNFSTRTAVANAARKFDGVCFSVGDITEFAHSTIYDACACALFRLNPSLVLEHCHIKFLRENVQYDQHLDTSTVDNHRPIIHVSDVHNVIIDKRFGRIKVDSKKNMQQEGNTTYGVISRGHSVVISLLDKVMADTVRDFVETDTYRKVKETLKEHGHVTMSGAAGGGKTAIALMLGKWYQEEGYELVLVEDVSKLYVDYYVFQEANTCFIFLDIMRPIERERDVLNLRRVLQQLKKSETKMVVIFTANTYNEKSEISQLGEEGDYFFSGQSFLDFNKLPCPYTPEEKKQIFTKLCQSFCTNLNVEYICEFQQFNFGFPQICTLFAGFQIFQNYGEEFFQKPFHYLKEAIETILQSANDQSGALILMFLCGGSLNLHQVELPSDNETLETLFITMKDVIRITTRTAVAMAVRQFRGSFFTKGDITGFAHPTIYDACACALYKDHRAFVLKHCSTKFLCDHVYTKEARHTVNGTMLYVQEAYIVELRNRLAKLNEGHPNYNVLKTFIDK